MADMKVAEMGGETPVGTTMAIMERGTKVMSAILTLALFTKVEFKLLANVFAVHGPYTHTQYQSPTRDKTTDL